MNKFKQNTPYATQAKIFIPKTEKIKGVNKKTYKEIDTFFCSFRTFGGTEKTVNNLLVVENTAIVETWYRPDITSDCLIEIGETRYEIISTPENINMQNQVMVFKIRDLRGGV